MKLTKYILHGGFPLYQKQVNDAFFKEILTDLGEEVRILSVYFATNNGAQHFSEDIEQFIKNCGTKKLEFEMADENLFEKQLENFDVIYLRGGSSQQLLDKLKKFPDFSKYLNGKTVAADSAGVNALSTIFYSHRNGVCYGLGILPIKFIPHFIEENRNKLNDVKPELETIMLPEYTFTILKR